MIFESTAMDCNNCFKTHKETLKLEKLFESLETIKLYRYLIAYFKQEGKEKIE